MGLQTIYNSLRSGGLSKWGALAVMGNLQAESGNESVRLEGDFDPSRRISKAWADDVDNNRKSRNDVIYMGRGWGLAQWTFWSRLAGLYDLCKSKGVSIGDEATQCEWLLTELSNYQSLLSFLKTAKEDECYEATRRFCVEFERPAINNVQTRYNNALEIGKKVSDDQQEPDQLPETLWPPRTLKRGMFGADVFVLQSVLVARGYNIDIDGVFGKTTETAVIMFKRSEHLSKPTIFGNKAWARLLRR